MKSTIPVVLFTTLDRSTGSSPPPICQALGIAEGRRALSGFFLFGALMSSLGPLLPLWGYHLDSSFSTVGHYFLSLSIGLITAVGVGPLLLRSKGLVFGLVFASSLGCVGFVLLAFTLASVTPVSRAAGLLCTGLSAGVLNAAVFQAISPLYERERAATITFAGILYGLGCLFTALMAAATYSVYSALTLALLFAAIPGCYIVIFSRTELRREPVPRELDLRYVLKDFKSLGAILFTLLLFFQFGNEWSVAGWLPLFLIRRLGISPRAALFTLAFYFMCLLVGRVLAQVLIKRLSHAVMLMSSILLALFGCIVLSYTTNRFGADMGILFIGCGFAPIYPLITEKIGHRFTYYHPGFYNGIFLFTFAGGLLGPCLIGYLAQVWEIGIAMVIPLIGTVMVLLLFLLILLESKFRGDNPVSANRVKRAGA